VLRILKPVEQHLVRPSEWKGRTDSQQQGAGWMVSSGGPPKDLEFGSKKARLNFSPRMKFTNLASKWAETDQLFTEIK
jgi:hypothetical protein